MECSVTRLLHLGRKLLRMEKGKKDLRFMIYDLRSFVE